MNVTKTHLRDVLIIEPRVFGDDRGFFKESWNAKTFGDHGLQMGFVQDNHSRSTRGILRGLHYQTEKPQGKLVHVTQGEVFDVAVDLREASPSFGQWLGVTLSADNHRMLWVPPGFAHGFLVMSESADFQYKCTDFYDPASEVCLAWNDQQLQIEWPIAAGQTPSLSNKDAAGLPWEDIPKFP